MMLVLKNDSPRFAFAMMLVMAMLGASEILGQTNQIADLPAPPPKQTASSSATGLQSGSQRVQELPKFRTTQNQSRPTVQPTRTSNVTNSQRWVAPRQQATSQNHNLQNQSRQIGQAQNQPSQTIQTTRPQSSSIWRKAGTDIPPIPKRNPVIGNSHNSGQLQSLPSLPPNSVQDLPKFSAPDLPALIDTSKRESTFSTGQLGQRANGQFVSPSAPLKELKIRESSGYAPRSMLPNQNSNSNLNDRAVAGFTPVDSTQDMIEASNGQPEKVAPSNSFAPSLPSIVGVSDKKHVSNPFFNPQKSREDRFNRQESGVYYPKYGYPKLHLSQEERKQEIVKNATGDDGWIDLGGANSNEELFRNLENVKWQPAFTLPEVKRESEVPTHTQLVDAPEPEPVYSKEYVQRTDIFPVKNPGGGPLPYIPVVADLFDKNDTSHLDARNATLVERALGKAKLKDASQVVRIGNDQKNQFINPLNRNIQQDIQNSVSNVAMVKEDNAQRIRKIAAAADPNEQRPQNRTASIFPSTDLVLQAKAAAQESSQLSIAPLENREELGTEEEAPSFDPSPYSNSQAPFSPSQNSKPTPFSGRSFSGQKSIERSETYSEGDKSLSQSNSIFPSKEILERANGNQFGASTLDNPSPRNQSFKLPGSSEGTKTPRESERKSSRIFPSPELFSGKNQMTGAKPTKNYSVKATEPMQPTSLDMPSPVVENFAPKDLQKPINELRRSTNPSNPNNSLMQRNSQGVKSNLNSNLGGVDSNKNQNIRKGPTVLPSSQFERQTNSPATFSKRPNPEINNYSITQSKPHSVLSKSFPTQGFQAKKEPRAQNGGLNWVDVTYNQGSPGANTTLDNNSLGGKGQTGLPKGKGTPSSFTNFRSPAIPTNNRVQPGFQNYPTTPRPQDQSMETSVPSRLNIVPLSKIEFKSRNPMALPKDAWSQRGVAQASSNTRLTTVKSVQWDNPNLVEGISPLNAADVERFGTTKSPFYQPFFSGYHFFSAAKSIIFRPNTYRLTRLQALKGWEDATFDEATLLPSDCKGCISN